MAVDQCNYATILCPHIKKISQQEKRDAWYKKQDIIQLDLSRSRFPDGEK